MSPYQRTLQMYCPLISSKYCAECCFSKTLQLRVALVVHDDEQVQHVERRDLDGIHCSLLPTGDPRGPRKRRKVLLSRAACQPIKSLHHVIDDAQRTERT